MSSNRVVAYFCNWTYGRRGAGRFDVDDIDPSLLTHAIYAFVGLTQDGEVKVLDDWNDIQKRSFERFVALKQQNPRLKTLIAMGGWNEGSNNFTVVMNNENRRHNLVNSIYRFVEKYGFDGFDLDWEYPNDRGGQYGDIAAVNEFLRELSEKFRPKGYLITVAVGASASRIQSSYDVRTMNKYVNFFNLLTYDMHGVWENRTGHNAGLNDVKAAVAAWINAGADTNKLVLGIPCYGHTFQLSNSGNTGINAPTNGPGEPGEFTQEAGFLSYLEIGLKRQAGGWTVQWDGDQSVPYMWKGNEWVSYDDIKSVGQKAIWARQRGLGGVMAWSLDSDDGHNVLGGGKFPLLNAMINI